jgi:hypothetical protein
MAKLFAILTMGKDKKAIHLIGAGAASQKLVLGKFKFYKKSTLNHSNLCFNKSFVIKGKHCPD